VQGATGPTGSGGGGGFPSGANICTLPVIAVDNGGSFGGYSLLLRVASSQVVAWTAAGFKLKLWNGDATGNVIVNKAVLRRTAPNSITFIDTANILFSGSATVTFGPKTFATSDTIALAFDTSHDYYFIVYIDPTQSSAVHMYGTLTATSGSNGLWGAYQNGDQTATADTTAFTWGGNLTAYSNVLTA